MDMFRYATSFNQPLNTSGMPRTVIRANFCVYFED